MLRASGMANDMGANLGSLSACYTASLRILKVTGQ